jgi:hypothetical protein
MSTIPTQTRFPTSNQNPSNSILDAFNKQAYLGNTYIIDTGPITLSNTTETPILYVLNASTTVSAFVSQLALNAEGTDDVITYRVYIASTGVSSGTTATPHNTRPANANISQITAKLSPTVSGNGTRLQTFVMGFNAQTTPNPMIILDPGQSLLITGQAATTATAIASIIHYEL